MSNYKSLTHFFKGSDIDIAITRWQVEGTDEYRIYLTMSDDRQQRAFMTVGDRTFLIDFKLSEKDGQLIYSDLNFMRDYVVDLSDFKRLKLTSTLDAAEVYLIRQSFEDLKHR